MNTPRIYLADLHAYNNGILRGGWIDIHAGMTAAEIIEEAVANGYLAQNPYNPDELNEFAIHDHEGFGDAVKEYTSLDTVCEIADVLDGMTDEQAEAYREYAGNVGEALPDVDGFHDSYCGIHETFQAYAEELFDERYLDSVPENVRGYIDYEAFARDLSHDGYWFSPSVCASGVHVFTS